MKKEIKIKVPEGYEMDKENSTFECIKFKPIKKYLTYKDVCDITFKESFYFINNWGTISFIGKDDIHTKNTDRNNAPSKKQLQKVLAINQLMNIAKYYNGNWEPDKTSDSSGYCIKLCYIKAKYAIERLPASNYGIVTFKNKEDAEAVIDNPNFRDILDTIFK